MDWGPDTPPSWRHHSCGIKRTPSVCMIQRTKRVRLTFPSYTNILFSKFLLKLIEKVLFYSIKQEGLTMLSTKKRILTRIRRRGPGGTTIRLSAFLKVSQRLVE